MKIPEQLS